VESAELTPVVLAFAVEYSVIVGCVLMATGKHQVPDGAYVHVAFTFVEIAPADVTVPGTVPVS
jgi:hypothetical protein